MAALTIVAILATSFVTFVSVIAVAPPAEARYAEGGDGLYPGYIDWFEWGADGTPITSGTSVTNTRLVGLNTLETTCTITNVVGPIRAYRPGDYRGDALDNLYNIGGIDDANQLVSGIANQDNGGTVDFDFECFVTLQGNDVAVAGLVVADAESNNFRQGEFIAATPDQPATWRVIDRARACDTATIATLDGGNTLTLASNDTQCAEVNDTYGPIAVGFMEGATGAHITMKGGGFSAVALGVVFESDFGDAPTSYGSAGALLQSTWVGGTVPFGTTTDVSSDAFALGVPGGYAPILGATVDSDAIYIGSPNADYDDNTGNPASDEDSIAPPGVLDTDFGETYALDIACTGPGFVAGWVDWNFNGTFDESERAGAAECVGSSVNLSWTVPDDAVQTVVEPSFLRLRIADTVEGAQNPNDITSLGEVEDYPIYVDLPDPGLTLTKVSDATGPLLPGDDVEYTITVTNSGEVDYNDENGLASFTDDLTDVLDDAVYNDDESATVGIATYGAPVLSWSGPLPIGASASVTYSVSVNDPISGNGLLDNTVVGPAESNCAPGSTDPDCQVAAPVQALEIEKTVSPMDQGLPGETVTYSVTVTNTGQSAYSEANPASIVDDLSDVLDDATYNGDATASSGDVVFTDPELAWTGQLAVGESVTITYSVTVNDPLTGDGLLVNGVVGPPESNCDDGTETGCTTEVPIRGLEIVKTSDGAQGVEAGDTVNYTVTITNTGSLPYEGGGLAQITDDLSDVLDDATYNDDAFATSGVVEFVDPNLTWEGALLPGETVTITYSVTVNDPLTGDGNLYNVVVGPPESNCTDPAETQNADCIEPDPIRALEITKSSDPTDEVLPGETVTYSVTVENTGEFNYTLDDPASFSDDLTDVLDDATYNNDAAAGAGTVTFTDPVLSWSGPLDAGQSVTITYTVTVDDPPTGDGLLVNTVVGPSESNCDDGTETGCTTEVPVKALEIAKSSTAVGSAIAGDVVTYTITVTNTGQADYTVDDPAAFEDSLAEVLDDATYNGDATASGGTVGFADPVLSWSGALAAGESVTITYSVTVNNPLSGDGVMTNAVVGPPESNCDAADAGPECEVTVPLAALEIEKVASPSGEVLPGGTVTYTVTVTNTGQAPYLGATFIDDLTDVLDDATYNNDATADIGDATYSAPELTWAANLAAGATATITYSVTVNDPLTGDGLLENAVVGPDGSNCVDGTEAGCTTEVPVKALEIEKIASPSGEVLPGGTVTYTVTVTNAGEADYTVDAPASFDDDLSAVLDDAVYNADATASGGTASFAAPVLSWSGALAAGESVTITYSVTVNDPLTGDGLLTNAVVGPPESNCDDGTETGCTTEVPVKALEIEKLASPSGEVLPGGTVTYTVTVTNTGQADYTVDSPASFDDDLSAVLDDATYNGDALASGGTASFADPVLSWEGPLAVGESVTITYSVTVNDPPTGDGLLINAVVGPPESNCDDGTETGCTTEVPVKALEIVKSSDSGGSALPGDVVTYSVTITNSGEADYTVDAPAFFDDDLTGVLDDATYNGDATASGGTVSFTDPVLSWSGALAAGESVTITYSVTVNDPLSGDGELFNVVVGPPESNCDSADTTDPDCVEPNPIQALEISKVASPDTEVLPGGTVTYTVTVENTGQVDYTVDAPASFTDDLTDVLDDAAYNGDAVASGGTASFADPVLSWEGPLAVGETVTITYSVTVDDPPTGDGLLINAVVGPPESNCDDGTEEPCTTEVPVKALEIEKVADPADAVAAGSTVTYTVTVTNSGQADYTVDAPASFEDDLTDVLDDAAYNGDATASGGTVSFADPVLSWSGALAAGESVTITYSVTVDDPPTGDGLLTNAVVGPPESNCDDGTETGCTTEVPVKALEIAKSSNAVGSALPGDVVTYTITVTNTGQVDYLDPDLAGVTDDLSAVLDDATYNGDAAASSGDLVFTSPELSWTGELAAGDTVVITYSVTVNDPPSGDGLMTNAVVGPPESNCDLADAGPECEVTVPLASLEIEKVADPSGEVLPGGTVTYTVTVTNTGQVDYLAATFDDDLTAVLDDATYNGDATASGGTASFADPVLSWTGPLAVGESVTVTYSVTVNDPLTGDGLLDNAVVGPPESNCDDGTETGCTTEVPVKALEIEKVADPAAEVLPDGTVTYTVTVTNTGQVDYTVDSPASFDDDLSAVLDDATYNADATASGGTVGYSAPTLSWSGPLAVGETVTITYSVTVNDPLTGDGLLDNAVVGPPESNCDDGTETGCTTEVPVKALEILKTADPSDEVLPGGTVTYTVTVTNTGQADYTVDAPASFDDDLSAVLDDATYNGDASASGGTVSFADPVLSWSGALAAGETVTVTYSVTVNDPTTGDGLLDNAVVGPPESNCDDGAETGCTTEVPVRELELVKTSDSGGEVLPGDVVTYTVTVTNTGQVDYTADAPASFDDDLSQLLDDAAYNGDASASGGTASYAEPILSWEGPLAVGESVTITYSVTVNEPLSGDGELFNVVVGPPESNCDSADTTDPDCVEPNPIRALEITKQAAPGEEVLPGNAVTYTITVTNTGVLDYTDLDPATLEDDLTEVLDDAIYNGDATASGGTASFAAPVLSWEGPLAAGETVTITYSVTVNDPLTGDGLLDNAVVGPPESNCDDGTETGCTTEVPVKALQIEKVADPAAEVLPDGTVTYTVTVTNTGQVDYTVDSPASFDDDLTAVLDDATYNADATASGGTVSFADPVLSWEGPLAAGETVTVTYSVTVDKPLTGDGLLDNAVVGPPESNCDDGTETGCTTEVPVRALELAKSSDAVGSTTPGEVVTYTVTITNSGQVDYTADAPAQVSDDLAAVLDDATYNGDATASGGTVSFADPVLSWSGALAVGETVTLTYSVTVNDPLTGDGVMTNTVEGPPESNCPDADASGPECEVEVPIQALDIIKAADPADEVLPGGTVTYTVTLTNTGQVDYSPASITDDLSEVLDDAVYNGDAAASAGAVDYMAPILSWSGAIGAGESVTITYSVTVNDPLTGDGLLDNAVVGPDGSNCEDGTETGCTTEVPVKALELTKSVDPADEVLPGDVVTYTVTVENIGQADYTVDAPASAEDDLSAVLDDATYNGDASASGGTVSFADPVLSWSGPLAVGETVTITYSVTVDDPPLGDGILTNAVTGPPESNCDDGTETGCTTEVPLRSLEIFKSASPDDEVLPGGTVTYTVTVTNSGQVDYTADEPAALDDDLSAVLDDAVYNADATASGGTVSFADPVLSWSGPLAVGESVTITYSVTVNDPLTGDGLLDNAVVGPPESNCDDGTETGCTTEVPVKALEILKTVDPSDEVLPGGTVTYTVTVENIGQADYTVDAPASFDDDLSAVLDDATYNGDASASGGTASFADPVLSWSGPLAVGETVTITYSVTVNDPLTGDGLLDNAVVGPPESNCDDGTETGCTTEVPIRALQILKTADPSDEVLPGGTVTYTITLENIGQVDYLRATFTDDLSEVIDDAAANGDFTASAGGFTYAEPELTWAGPIAVGDTVTITYSVTVNDPMSGDGWLRNAVTGPPESNCEDGTTDPDCATEVPVKALEMTKTSDTGLAARPGDTVTYTITVENIGQVPYTDSTPAELTDDLSDVLDDAVYNGDAIASDGDVTYAEPVLSWSGPLDVGATVTITYSVTVDDPRDGDGFLGNAVVGPPESNCEDGSTDPACETIVALREMQILKVAEPEGSVTVGDVVTYTVTVTNTGQLPYTEDVPASFTDDLSDVLDDATYNDDVAATGGDVSFADPFVNWSGPLAVGESVTVTYSVTVGDPPPGDAVLANAVFGPGESNCPVQQPRGLTQALAAPVALAAPEMPEGCQVVTPIRMFEVSKTVDTAVADPGDVVTYTVTVESTGTAPYTEDQPAGFTDDLSDVLDDATWNDDATASAGSTTFADPTLSWSGPLDVGGVVTVTYSVTVDDPTSGNEMLGNVVFPTEGGGTCESDEACMTSTEITPPVIPPTTDVDGGGLSNTGADGVLALTGLALLLTLTGAGAVVASRRGQRWTMRR